MSKTQFRLSVGALFALILLFNITSPNRYKTTLFSDKLVMKTDGITGKVWFYTKENGWTPLLGSKMTKPGTIQNATKIPATLLSDRNAKKPATKPNE